MPVTEAFFGGPVIGYSKVTVRSIHRNGTHGDSVVRSAIGKQVTEYYTAKDYPAYTTYTGMNALDYHLAPAFSFFHKQTIDQRTVSQGFLVVTNDMHGKLKSQTVYSEGDPNTPLSYTKHTYKNTGANGLNDLVQFVHNEQGGAISSGNIGVDMELMTSVREYDAQSQGTDDQANIDFFTFAPIPIFAVFFYPLTSFVQNTYKEVNTTKLINYHAVEDSVVVNDKGSTVTTRTVAYDGQTGTPVVTRTENEYKDSIFNVSLPAYWAYSGMGPAYNNIGMVFSNVNIKNGLLVSGIAKPQLLESGDELLVTGGPTATGCSYAANLTKIWVYDTSKNSTPLSVPSANRLLMFLDSAGNPITGNGFGLMVVRSGHRNLLGQTAGTVTAMSNPVQMDSGQLKLVVNNSDNVVAAAATAYREKWQVDADVIPATVMVAIPCGFAEVPSCGGTMPNHVNPYQRGLVGDFKAYRNYVYYGSRLDSNPATPTRIRHNGYISGFGNYWNFNSYNNLVADSSNTNWLWNTEVTRVNSKGQELETHDALNRYTAAQYGFAKNFPVAVTQNAPYGQSFYTGFEDNNYSETLNNSYTDTCQNARYINLSDFNIINTDTTTVKAHTGRYAIRVPANTTDTLPIPVAPPDSLNYTMTFGDSLRKRYDSVGIWDTLIPAYPNTVYVDSPNFYNLTGSTGVTANIEVADGQHFIVPEWKGYLQIPATGNYTFTMSASGHNGHYAGTELFEVELEVDITGLTNGYTASNYVLALPADGAGTEYNSNTYTLSLCKGTYLVHGIIFDEVEGGSPINGALDQFMWSCTNCGCSLTTSRTSEDTVTTAIKAAPAMMNSTFNLLPGQKMQFSGWVSQDCGTPCLLTNYTHPGVSLQFPGADTPSIVLHPKGPIIEGWQRVDTMFTVPINATTAKLVLSSDSAVKVYFDDIRIHPFNADMKTYVYDPQNLRLMAELDENNYATFYNYDQEGQLVRVKKETVQGIKTIKETRTAKQKSITNVQ